MVVKKVLLCTDFSEGSELARTYAVEYCKAFGAELCILHVMNFWAGFPAYESRIPIDVRQIVNCMEEAVKKDLAAAANKCENEIRSVTTHAMMGIPAETIVKFARDERADLVVMGTHGWTGFKHILLGSTAENVARTATCPVLVVRPPKTESAGS